MHLCVLRAVSAAQRTSVAVSAAKCSSCRLNQSILEVTSAHKVMIIPKAGVRGIMRAQEFPLHHSERRTSSSIPGWVPVSQVLF